MFFLFLLSIWQSLEKLDQWLFIKINSDLSNPFFDSLMPFMRYPLNWAPLYLFLGAFVLLNYKGKGAWWILFFIVTIALTDMTGNYVFKHGFERIRPCGDPDFFMHVRLLTDHCSTGYSFVSNHAANHFGIAAFFFITFRHILKKWAWIGFAWAFIIAYAQIYVGLHFPLDVICGAIIGIILGLSMGSVFNKRFGFVNFDAQQQPVD